MQKPHRFNTPSYHECYGYSTRALVEMMRDEICERDRIIHQMEIELNEYESNIMPDDDLEFVQAECDRLAQQVEYLKNQLGIDSQP